MAQEKIIDPVLGENGRFYGKGEHESGFFTKEFSPTKGQVVILVNVVNGSVPQAQRDLYREIEAWYPTGVHQVFKAIRHEVEQDTVLRKWLPPDQIPTLLRLIAINIRYPFQPPAKCVLEYQFDSNAPVWYVRLAEDYQIEWCGLGD